ncbi:MAG: hypothetical protein KDA91_02790 [Planctomycetaceae bacterium]|nr:hypothetical protein [Planctomycetaceae bacterium]
MRFASSAVVVFLILGLAGSAPFGATAQEKSKSKSSASSKEKEKQASPWRRLPPGYGSLELSETQKEKVYSIRQEYGAQIDDLQEQIKTLREKMNKETEAILTTDQKKSLAANEKPEEGDSTEKKSSGTAKKSSSKSRKTK